MRSTFHRLCSLLLCALTLLLAVCAKKHCF